MQDSTVQYVTGQYGTWSTCESEAFDYVHASLQSALLQSVLLFIVPPIHNADKREEEMKEGR